MEQETERFIAKIESLFKFGQVGVSIFQNLIKEWGQLISTWCYEQDNTRQTFLNLNRLKLSIQWFKQTCTNKSEVFQNFLQYLIQYIGIELDSIKMLPEETNNLSDISEPEYEELKWTANKRALYELICAIDAVKCINNGNIKLNKLLERFEGFFKINLTQYYTEINKMASRKLLKNNDSQARFLFELISCYDSKMLEIAKKTL